METFPSIMLAGLLRDLLNLFAGGDKTYFSPIFRPRDIVSPGKQRGQPQISNRLRRSALVMTETELNVMAALAIIGLRRTPKIG